MPPRTRRHFLKTTAATLLAGCSPRPIPPTSNQQLTTSNSNSIIDLHQHTNYSDRTDGQLLAHQRNMGVTTTILLPAGHPAERPSTHMGRSNGLAARTGPNETCYRLAQEHPGQYHFFANETPDVENARQEIEKYLKLGALGIGEQKFNIDVESDAFTLIADLAKDYAVPVLCHFQIGMYNHGYDRLWRVLDRYPTVPFIAHAQTTWANIDRNADNDPRNLYPKTPVATGGLTDQYLSDYANFYADMSAGSGLNALTRDPDRAKAFILRHQDKLIYGSDCNDLPGKPPICQGALTITAIKRLSPSKQIARKLLHDNAAKLFRL
jgi:predicted TIM-barrel fold metal-dependent hydrolase